MTIDPNKSNNRFSIASRLKSFKYALNGILLLLKSEHNSRIHLAVAILAVVAGFYFEITNTEWIYISLAIALVFITELLNSALENIADVVSPEQNPKIGNAKDLAAAAVMIAAIFSILVALFIFIPKIEW